MTGELARRAMLGLAGTLLGAGLSRKAAAAGPDGGLSRLREHPTQVPVPSSLTFTDAEGTVRSFADFRGRGLVVNFWATWCAPCLKEIPDLNALDAKREDLEVVGLAYEEITPEAMRAFYGEKVRPEYPVAIVDVYNPPADFETPRGLPFTILVAPDGTVAHQFLGPVTGADIEAKISEVVAAATPA